MTAGDGRGAPARMNAANGMASAVGRSGSFLLQAWWRLPARVRWTMWIACALGILVTRRPETVTRAEFFNEDGQVFYIGTYFGSPLDVMLRPYSGYLCLVPRLVAFAARAVPVVQAPLVTNAAALFIVALVAAYAASDRLSPVLPGRPLRWALGGLLLALPASYETLGSITEVNWYLAIFLLAALGADAPSARWMASTERAALLAAGLSGPFSALFAPLYLARAAIRRDRTSAWAAAIVAGSGLVQAAVFLTSGREGISRSALAPDGVLELLGLRLVDVPLIGVFWTRAATLAGCPVWLAAIVTVALCCLLVIVLRALPGRLVAASGFVIVVLALSAVLREPHFSSLLDVGTDERFFLVPGLLIEAAVVMAFAVARARPHVAASVLCCLLVFAIAGDFRLPAYPDLGWVDRSGCIGGPLPCDVPVYTPGWSIEWPGSGGSYVQPDPYARPQ